MRFSIRFWVRVLAAAMTSGRNSIGVEMTKVFIGDLPDGATDCRFFK